MEVIILRGIPGCGKSAYAGMLKGATAPSHRYAVFSADNFFIVAGKYRFDPSKLPEAHAECLRLFVEYCFRHFGWEEGTVVVDNTNITAAEVAPYYAIATAYEHKVRVVNVNPHVSPDIAHKRNVHGVPSTTCDRMRAAMMSERFPPWWNISDVVT